MLRIKEIWCRSGIGKCGFPGGGWAINPYIGCQHGCVYCYARFMRRFTGHVEPWGTFVDVRINIAEALTKQLRSSRFRQGRIYIGTVTDPYQPLERKYQLTKKILKALLGCQPAVSILTKSDLVLRDLDLLRQFNDLDISFTINTLDKKWKKLTEPHSPSVERRLAAIKRLAKDNLNVCVMMGPYWPFFTDPAGLFLKFSKVRARHVFSESLNTVGGNWAGVERVLRNNYPSLLPKIRAIMFNQKKFTKFYRQAAGKINNLSRQYKLPVTLYFAPGHAGKFK